METIYGIDLGTSNCLAAKVTRYFGEDQVDCLEDEDGNISFPSIVHFSTENNAIVGEGAKVLLPEQPDQTIELVKTRMGKTLEVNLMIAGKEIIKSPQEISSRLLRHFHELHSGEIKKAILTVPAYFNDNQKMATLDAGKLAGIDIVELIEEPSAAIMYHLFKLYKEEGLEKVIGDSLKNFLVFDFGGGTLDLSLIQVELDDQGEVKPTVLLNEGDPALGGNDIDFYFTKYVIRQLLDLHHDDFLNDVYEEFEYFHENRKFQKGIDLKVKQLIMRLKEAVVDAKEKLSNRETVRIMVSGNYNYKNVDVTQKQFEDNVLDYYFNDPVVDAMKRLFYKNINNYRIDNVIMVGGTSQIPFFQKLLEAHFDRLKGRIVISEDYDKAIALGAAILGAIHSGLEVKPFGKHRCHSTVSHNIFVSHNNEDSLLIPYGTSYPFEQPKKISFRIRHSLDQSINIQIKEKHEIFDNTRKQRVTQESVIKEVRFYHPFFYTNEDISVTLSIDHFGLLSFEATHDITNEKIEFESEKRHQLSDQQIQQLKQFTTS